MTVEATSKKKSKRLQWQQLLILLGSFYFIMAGVFVYAIINIPNIYNYNTIRTVEKIEKELQEILLNNDEVAVEKELNTLAQNNKIELIVLLPEQVVYATVPTTSFTELDAYIDGDAFSKKISYEYPSNGKIYQVYLAIYKADFASFFTFIVSFIFVGVLMLCLIISVLLFVMFQKMVNPLKRLRDNIIKLKDYRLQEVGGSTELTDYDLLSAELGEFTEDLQDKLETITIKYTGFEKELQAKQERQNYKEQLVTALVHDLKTPLNISTIEVEKIKKNPEKFREADFEIIERNNNRILEAVNEILVVLKNDSIDTNKAEVIDIVQISRETLRLFQPIFKKRNIQAYLEAPQKIEIYFNGIEFKQILHNIVSNASNYATDGGMFELEIDTTDDYLWIRAYNDLDNIDAVDFERVFDLFYHVNVGDNDFGSGIGMYTINSMVEEYKGTCVFEPFEAGVQLIIEIPLSEVSIHENE